MDDRPHQYVVLMCLKKSDIAYIIMEILRLGIL